MSLKGKRVLVTRSSKQAGKLSLALQQAGAVPVQVPVIAFAPPQDPEPFRRAVAAVERYEWVVLTSTNGVEALFDELGRQGREPAVCLRHTRVAAIGPATAKALRDGDVIVEVVPDEYRGEAMATAVIARYQTGMAGVRILLARAAEARDALPELLREAGALVEVVEAYRAVPPGNLACARLRKILEQGELDAITFTSSSTVRHTLQMLGGDAHELLRGLVVASIGPITTETADGNGLRVNVTAAEYTIDGLVKALTDHYQNQE